MVFALWHTKGLWKDTVTTVKQRIYSNQFNLSKSLFVMFPCACVSLLGQQGIRYTCTSLNAEEIRTRMHNKGTYCLLDCGDSSTNEIVRACVWALDLSKFNQLIVGSRAASFHENQPTASS
jgi:hypothetical protein